jgi:hypothetical protein
MEYISTQNPTTTINSLAQKCITKMRPDKLAAIKSCALGSEGKKLLLKYAKTAARNNITQEPTIIINGKHLPAPDVQLALKDFIKYGCEKMVFKQESQMCKSYFEFLGSDDHQKWMKEKVRLAEAAKDESQKLKDAEEARVKAEVQKLKDAEEVRVEGVEGKKAPVFVRPEQFPQFEVKKEEAPVKEVRVPMGPSGVPVSAEEADRVEVAKNEADKAEAERVEAAEAEADRVEASKANAAKAEADRVQAAKAEAAKAEAAKAEAAKAEAAKAEVDRFQAVKAEAAKAEADRFQAVKAEAAKAEADRFQAVKAEAAKAEAAKAEADRFQAVKAEAAQPKTAVEDDEARAAATETTNTDEEQKRLDWEALKKREAKALTHRLKLSNDQVLEAERVALEKQGQ